MLNALCAVAIFTVWSGIVGGLVYATIAACLIG